MSRLSLSIALVFGLSGCETQPREAFRRVRLELASGPAEQRQSASQRLNDVDARLRQELPTAPVDAHRRCPDERLEVDASARNKMFLRVRDARAERRGI